MKLRTLFLLAISILLSVATSCNEESEDSAESSVPANTSELASKYYQYCDLCSDEELEGCLYNADESVYHYQHSTGRDCQVRVDSYVDEFSCAIESGCDHAACEVVYIEAEIFRNQNAECYCDYDSECMR